MVENMWDDDVYIYYFRQLLDFETLLKDNQLDDERSIFEIEIFNKVQQRKIPNKVKRSNLQRHDLIKVQKPKGKLFKDFENNSNKIQILSSTLEKENNVNWLNKHQIRSDMLKHFSQYCEEETKYETFLNSLIDLEESFVG